LGRKCTRCVMAAVAALCVVPIASAGRVVSVGYRTPTALRGLQVVSRVAALRTAEVRAPGIRAERALRSRPGIRFVQRTISRSEMGASSVPLTRAILVPEWQWTAMHADLVPTWVQQAAHTITIAVIDTGADVLAPSLAAKSPTTWNVVNGSGAVSDTVGHGTFVASLAGGTTSDPAGMLGFGGDARLMIVQANRGGTGFSDIDEANAIVYAVDHSANIINLSLGGSQTSQVERDAIDYATQHGVLLVAAAGNSAEQGNPTVYPAALIGRGGLVVGASTTGGTRASFSTTGSYVDVLAPGVDVLGALASGIPTGFFAPAATPGANGTYGYGTGTSFAAPEVAGAAALVWAANPGLDAAGVAATLEATAGSQSAWTNDLAFGSIDVAAAVERAAGAAPPAVAKPVVKPKAQKTQKPAARKIKGRAVTKKAKHARP
jgi:serine protease